MAKDMKKGLGRGLSELFGEDILENEGEGELIYVPIAKVEPRTEQPRNRFDEDALQELSDSIAQYGLIQPITVRRQDSGYYQIIAGERRWRASRMAGLIEVPVRVIDADDRRVAARAKLVCLGHRSAVLDVKLYDLVNQRQLCVLKLLPNIFLYGFGVFTNKFYIKHDFLLLFSLLSLPRSCPCGRGLR